MLFQFNHILAVKMYQFSTFFAFAVETGHLVAMLLCSKIFKTGTACPVYIVFCNQSLLYHLFKITVNCCRSDIDSLLFEIGADICGRHMCTLYRLKINQYLFHLFCLIRCFRSHNFFLLFTQNENRFHIISHSDRVSI